MRWLRTKMAQVQIQFLSFRSPKSPKTLKMHSIWFSRSLISNMAIVLESDSSKTPFQNTIYCLLSLSTGALRVKDGIECPCAVFVLSLRTHKILPCLESATLKTDCAFSMFWETWETWKTKIEKKWANLQYSAKVHWPCRDFLSYQKYTSIM